ncbi:DivIVA domain-containing protein [Clostridium luticellarii]|uniref:Septum site-determining protein DivIVA n=1 Tax=Clostridium luticellarii TaxID=1691940 RepID=A0A2T0BRR7_9CLOT|nr:DivIVA domain-containing protein [Clostridium luticellarii]MCI1943720.1 DivIVA domain-containing protein [Clostridium luticellarii]MCI1966981.1 DivIVA domain-containing protein [Clostridium luticellarii]MCI1994348.1 DivIVA domain-containing protein [Clostridium luticellarii]MCI2038699.1 DivIVA domain-containing protein [Clostridium luticellarii]PRR86574.1 Septum site-determining protein DivIVA [Clostridium luticellarii]
MHINAVEITNKEFKKSLRGYNIDEVDEFLDKIAEDYESLQKENSFIKEKLQSVEDKINHYNKMENTIQNTLLLAQNASEQAKENAKRESEFILKNANDAAQKIIDKAHSDVIQINDEFERVKQEFGKFRTKFRNFMKTQLEMFDDMEKDFVKSYDIGYELNEYVSKDRSPKADSIKEKEIEKADQNDGDTSLEIKKDNPEGKNEEEDELEKHKDDILTDENELNEIKNFFVKG